MVRPQFLRSGAAAALMTAAATARAARAFQLDAGPSLTAAQELNREQAVFQ